MEPNASSPFFNTTLGPRRLPRQIPPRDLDAWTINDIRRGVVPKFFPSGQIIRASALGSMVNPRTAKISLSDSREMYVSLLLNKGYPTHTAEKVLRNLFFVCVEADELPSYKFWRDQADPNPVINLHEPIDERFHKATDWFKVLGNKQKTAAGPGTDGAYEQAREREEEDGSPAPSELTHTPGLTNKWMEGGKYYRENNPKRNSYLSSQQLGETIKNELLHARGALLTIPYNSADRGKAQGYGQFGPQPGDPEWEVLERELERDLTLHGLETVLHRLERSHPERYRELTRGKKPSKVKPSRENDGYDVQFNRIQKVTIPTVAFKLTQQQFNRPTSPLNGQEPLVRDEDPKGWYLQGKEAREFDTSEITRDEEGELDFLDSYSEKSNEESNLRRRETISEERIDLDLKAPSLRPDRPDEDNVDSRNLHVNSPQNRSATSGSSSRLEPESVYKNLNGEIQLPQFEITGGPDMPTVYARVPTLSEIQVLQERLRHLENQILLREDSCRVCDKVFRRGSSNIEAHYQEHRLALQVRQEKTKSTPPVDPKDSTSSASSDSSETSASTAKSIPTERDEYGRVIRNRGQGWYCSICYVNVTTLGITRQRNHTRKCNTLVEAFLALTKDELAQRKRDGNIEGEAQGRNTKRTSAAKAKTPNSSKKRRVR